MYSTKIIESNVEKYETATKTKLIRYDYARIAEIIPILTRVYNDGKPLRGWKREESDFIRNEQVLSKLDFHYWCERYCHINYGGINQMGAGVMNLWESQKLLLKLVGSCEESSWDAYNRGETSDGILIGHNKARQMGATMICRAIIMHRETTHKNTRGFSASVDDDKVAELYTRDKNIHNNLPFYLQPSLDSRDESIDQQSQLLHYGKLNSSVLYQTSNQKSGFGQGRTFDVSHITEAASFDADGRGFGMIEHDFLPTIPQAPTVFCLLESTPQGRGNTWHTWSEAVRLGNKARWKYLFVPAYINRDRNRRTPPINWQPAEHTLKYAIHIETTSPSVVGYKVTPDRDYLYWYETQRKEYYDSGKLNMFYTNFASTPEESFQFVTSGAFDAELLNDLSLDNEPGVSYEFEPASMRF